MTAVEEEVVAVVVIVVAAEEAAGARMGDRKLTGFRPLKIGTRHTRG